MDRIKIELLHCTPPSVLHRAIEKPYGSTIAVDKTPQVAKRILLEQKHESVGEHLNFSFDVDGCSRLCLMEWTRHRISSFTVRSTRFTLDKIKNMTDEEVFVSPTTNKINSESRGEVNTLMDTINLLKMLGYDKRKINDLAKYFVLESMRTSFVWTVNLRSLRNFLSLRMGNEHNKPHFEIKHCAQMIFDIVNEQTPYGYLLEDLK